MVSIVVPIYNEEDNVPEFHRAVKAVMEATGEDWEIVYVNDGSTDCSLDLLLEIQKRDPGVTVARFSRNFGHQAALTAGLQLAKGNAVILMDGDFQDPPEVLPGLVLAWQNGAKVVIAERATRAEKGLRGKLFPLFYKVMGFISDFPIPLNAGIFGLLDRQAVDAINRLQEGNRYLPGLRAWVGFPTAVIYYDRAARAAGEPKQTWTRLIRYAMDAIFSFSYKPLRLGMVLGAIVLSVALMFGVGVIGLSLADGSFSSTRAVAGYTIVAILLLGGIQLVCAGLLGEYIGRIYDEVRRRPLFLIEEVHSAQTARSATRVTTLPVSSVRVG
jgi:dolichol-phosphate mannosyltransferase